MPLLSPKTQINRLHKNATTGKGSNLTLKKSKIEKTAQTGVNIFSSLLFLTRPFLKPALGTARLSFDAEKILKKLFRKGYRPKEIGLYKLTSTLSPAQKKQLTDYLVAKELYAAAAQLNMVDSSACLPQLACHLLSKPSRSCLEKACTPAHPHPLLSRVNLSPQEACTSTPTGLSCNLRHPSLELRAKKEWSSSGANNLASSWKVCTPATKENLILFPWNRQHNSNTPTPTGATHTIVMQHDVDYGVCNYHQKNIVKTRPIASTGLTAKWSLN